MSRCSLRFALALMVISTALSVHAESLACTGNRLLSVGGPIRLDAEVFFFGVADTTGRMTAIDVSRPALTRYAAPFALFAYVFPDSRPIQIQFSAVQVDNGQTYRIIDQGPAYQIFPTTGIQPGQAEVRQIAFDHPLVFDSGQMLATTVRPATGTAPGLVFYDSASPQGVLAGAVDLVQAGSAPLSSFSSLPRAAAAAVVQGAIDCATIPAPELFIPVVGDIQGLAHYSTDVTLYGARPFFSPLTTNWTIRDRTRNPNSATLLTGSVVTPAVSGGRDPFGTLSGLPDSYAGSMTLSFPDYTGVYKNNDTLRVSDDAMATARITARVSLGETGSSINGVSCERIGHRIAVPFHVTANHRVNIGIASAQLNSCGIYKAATAVVARVNDGPNVIIAMPAETFQLDNITGPNSPLPGAIGLTDGVVYLTVMDEASRIVAYSSLLDNTSQSATLTYGTVVR
ncbi:MAG: hypothetical protein ACXV7D_11320 [Thermoanaerobaculia bacterium]